MSPSNKRIARALEGAPKLVTATIALMEELMRIMTQEIDVVSHRKLKEHPDLLKYKQKLAMDYRANMKAIAAQPDIFKKLSDEAKEVIREMAHKLAAIADQNARILRAAVGATQQLIQNIVAMVRTEVMPRQSYKNSAKAHLQLGNYSPTCQPVAFNRSV
jgi:flagellar biosynthesis/type III secretory pathway chaperone